MPVSKKTRTHQLNDEHSLERGYPVGTSNVNVGTIWYHPTAGFSRPFIINSIKEGITYSKNLDDGGEIDYPVEELVKFLTENPEYKLED
jgi:hypothetical protein